MGFLDTWWNISTSSFDDLIAAEVFEISCG